MGRLRQRLYVIIFESDTPAGKAFDVVLLVLILLSVFLVMAESMRPVRALYGAQLIAMEWTITILFTIEYILRLFCAPRPARYARSFFGIVDLVSILPTYLAVIFPASRYLMVVRLVRLLRIFRILKLLQYSREAMALLKSVRSSLPKISVFFMCVVILVVIQGTVLYLVEGARNPAFDSIPRSVYWAIVTLTTVGYGDITPTTWLGQFIAAIIMLTGFAIIAVPTGIVTVQMQLSARRDEERLQRDRTCDRCGLAGHTVNARYCRRCGESLDAKRT